MKKSDINQPPCYFDTYISKVEDIELAEAFQKSVDTLNNLDISLYNRLADFAYAEGKWTIKQVFQHIIDTERIMAYRALRFSRNDSTLLPGFDENAFANNAPVVHRTFEDILTELKLVRASSIALFNSYSDELLQRKGTMFNSEMSVLAVGFTIIGHEIHHMNVIKERYLSV